MSQQPPRTEPGPCYGENCDHISHRPAPRVTAELASLATAARAYLYDFRAEDERAERAPAGAIYVDYKSAAYRLAADLNKILTYLEEHPS